MDDGNDAERVLAAQIDAALRGGAAGDDIVRLIRAQRWSPADESDLPAEVLEGRPADGRRVPIRIYRAASRQLLAG